MWQSPNQNDVATDIEAGRRDGRYRDCTHLFINRHPPSFLWGGGTSPVYFATSCREDSLRIPPDAALAVAVGVPPTSEPRCPEDCRFFVDRARLQHQQSRSESRARWLARLKWPWSLVMGFFKWYANAAWETQVFIAFALLVIFAPVYAESLAKLLRAALHGK